MSSSCFLNLNPKMPSIKPVVTDLRGFCYSRNKEKILEYLKTYDTLKKEITFIDIEKFKWTNQAIQENDGAVTQRVDKLEAEFLAFKRSNPAEVDNMYTQLKRYRRGACCVCPSWLRKKDQETLDHYFQLLSMNENDEISAVYAEQQEPAYCSKIVITSVGFHIREIYGSKDLEKIKQRIEEREIVMIKLLGALAEFTGKENVPAIPDEI